MHGGREGGPKIHKCDNVHQELTVYAHTYKHVSDTVLLTNDILCQFVFKPFVWFCSSYTFKHAHINLNLLGTLKSMLKK